MKTSFAQVKLTLSFILVIFTFSYKSSAQSAQTCGNAIEAQSGSNLLPATSQSEFWYTYVVPETGKLVVSSETNLQVDISYNTCDNRYYAGAGIGGTSYPNATQGQVVFIRWRLAGGGGDFEWNANIVPLEEGDNCSLAKEIALGENLVPPGNGQYWFIYTMPADGRVVVRASGAAYFEILGGNCPDDILWYTHGNSEISVAFRAGDVVFVRLNVENGGDFTWNFEVEDLQEGNLCEMPKQAVDGSNAIPGETTSQTWLKYTKDEEGKAIFRTIPARSITAYSGSCGNLTFLESGHGEIVLANMAIGEEVLIQVYKEFGQSVDLIVDVEPIVAGDGCNATIVAEEGTNHLPATERHNLWYEFTMPGEGKLHITSATTNYVTIYSGNCGELYYQTQGNGNATAANLKANARVVIKWETVNFDDFDWELNIVPLSVGDNCTIAEEIGAGNHHVPASTSGSYWYKFTPASTGRLVITSGSDTYVELSSNSCSQPGWLASGQGGVSFPITYLTGDLFIRWLTSSSAGFDWNVAIEEFYPGDICSKPIGAQEGTNMLSRKGSYETWYSFTMPRDGNLKISTSAQYAYGHIFSNSCDNLAYEGGGAGGGAGINLEEGETILIKWSSGSSITWSLAVEDPVPGDYCEIALTAEDGVNTAPGNKNSYVWYKYTATRGGKLVVSSETNLNVTVYSGPCQSTSWLGAGSGKVSIVNATSGQEYLIRWGTIPAGFEWNVGIEDPQTGDLCSLPQTAVTGVNTVPQISSYYWYQYTVEEEGVMSVRSTEGSYVTIMQDNCGFGSQLAFGHRNVDVAGLEVGQKVLIRWDYGGGGNFDWSLGYKPLESGDICTMAEAANEGSNTVPDTYSYYYWFTYTMPKDGKLVVRRDTYGELSVYTNSCDQLLSKGSSYQGKLSIPSLTEGTEVFIRFRLEWATGFDWELDVEEPTPGDNCSLAEVAKDGANHLPATSLPSFWYSFTAPHAGKLTVSSDRNVYFNIYTNNCSNLYYKAGGSRRVYYPGFNEGDEIFVQWNTYSESDFDWELNYEEYGVGDKCIDPIVAREGTNNASYAPQWFKFVVPAEGKVTISSVGTTNVNTLLKLYKSCSTWYFGYSDNYEETTQSQLTVEDVVKGEEIYILWDRLYSSDAFDWTINFESSITELSDQMITFDPIGDRFYGDEIELAATASSGLSISYQIISGAAEIHDNVLTVTGTGEVVVEARQDGDYYFNPASPVQRTFQVAPALLVIKADDKTITYGDPLPQLTYTVSGLVFEETEEVLSQPVTIATEAGTEPAIGEYSISIGGGNAANYTVSYLQGVLTVEKLAQQLLFDPFPEKTFGDGPFELSAIGGASGNVVVFESSNAEVAVVQHNILTIVGAGASKITASQAGDNNHKEVSVTRDLLVKKASQEIVFAEVPAMIYGKGPYKLSAEASSGLPVSISSSNAALAVIEGGEIVIKAAGEIAWTVRQEGNQNYLPADPVVRLSTIGKAQQEITFGELPSSVGIFTGKIELKATASSGLPISYAIAGPAILNGSLLTLTGIGEVTITASQAGNSNYQAAQKIAKSFTVTADSPARKTQKISFSPIADKTFGDTPFKLTASSDSGLPVSFSVSSGAATLDGSTVTITGAGSVTLVATQAGDEFYHPAGEVSHTFNVHKATALVTISNLMQKADGTPKQVTVATDPEGLELEVSYNGLFDAPIEPGEYQVEAKVTDENYQGSTAAVLTLEVLETGVGLDNKNIFVFPNPVSDELTIDIEGNRGGTVFLFDLLGRKKLEKTLSTPRTVLQLRDEPTGIYLLVIEDEKGEMLKRIKVSKE